MSQRIYFIKLTKEQRSKVDKEDFGSLSKYNWQAQSTRTKKSYYAVRNNGYHKNGTRLKMKMHRQIMNCPKNMEVDHINGNTLDNRRQNLRICEHKDNIKNQKARAGISRYRGVTKHLNKWRARLTVNYKRICLGLFDTQEVANEASIKGRKKYYKNFSNA